MGQNVRYVALVFDFAQHFYRHDGKCTNLRCKTSPNFRHFRNHHYDYFHRRIYSACNHDQKQKRLCFFFFRNYRFSGDSAFLHELIYSDYEIFPDFKNAENASGFPDL